MKAQSPSNDGLSDNDLLILCALADDIHDRTRCGQPANAAEGKFLRLMRQRDLWEPKE